MFNNSLLFITANFMEKFRDSIYVTSLLRVKRKTFLKQFKEFFINKFKKRRIQLKLFCGLFTHTLK